jgi:hypothetical protein
MRELFTRGNEASPLNIFADRTNNSLFLQSATPTRTHRCTFYLSLGYQLDPMLISRFFSSVAVMHSDGSNANILRTMRTTAFVFDPILLTRAAKKRSEP